MERSAIIAGFLSLFLCACSNDLHTTYCNMLKSDLIFNGATSESRKKDIEESEKPLLQNNFNRSYCE